MRLILGVVALSTLVFAGSAEAGHRWGGATQAYGPDCRGLYKRTGQGNLVVGSVLGGQNRHTRYGDGTGRDYRQFQACFTSVSACDVWASRLAAQRPHYPNYARCTPVYMGLTPPPSQPWPWDPAFYAGSPSPVRARY